MITKDLGGPTPSPGPRAIVGVGASAGGLEALERLFAGMPAQTGMAFVVVQHLSPDHRSFTDELLARRTSIPIRQVEDGMRVEPDAIYLLPPRKDMILSEGRLLLTDKDPAQGVALPIDRFFRSLAQDAGVKGVGVILSGTGSDGSRGVRDIHDAGGLVLVQSPETAKFDGMPNSALNTGVVDQAAPPEEIPAALLKRIRHPLSRWDEEAPAASVVPAVGMESIYRRLREAYGIDFSSYKPETVSRRLERRLTISRAFNLDDYARRLESEPAELNQLYRDLLIGVTEFFRDDSAFASLKEALPALIRGTPEDEEFRVWVAGCASGEEAYSLGILIHEVVATLERPVPVKIFATDVHRASLDFAAAGQYPPESLSDVGPERLERYFVRNDKGYQVSPELRKMIVFAQHNLLKDAPFTKIDLISCRNLLIYFQPAAQKKVLSLFHFGLKTSGIMFLGPSESPGDLEDEFEAVDARWKLYRKRRDVRLPTDIRVPLAPASPRLARDHAGSPTGSANDTQLVIDSLVEQFMPPGFLINERRELVRMFAGAQRYLRFRTGWFSNDILDLVEGELRMALSGAIPLALRDMRSMAFRGLRVGTAEGERLINVTVKPIRLPRASMSYVVVQLEECGGPASALVPVREFDLGQASKDQLVSLEAELRYTKENLQATIEELETSNEELQATNEELVASNEELQSTNEELHSVNEELYTVNSEYQKKIVELTELTSDMDNLLSSTEVHTIFLDRNLCIRKYTPRIAETFNLLPQDVGRRIDSFTYNIEYPRLIEDLTSVLNEGPPVSHQVRDRRGNWFLLRVLPYQSGGATEGVVLTLVDIAAIKSAQAAARRKDEQLASILRNSPNLVFIKDLEGRYQLTDDFFKQILGRDPTGKTPHELLPREVADRLSALDQRVLAGEEMVEAEVEIPHQDGMHTYLSVMFPVRDDAGRLTGIGGVRTDVTQLKQAENQAREAVAQRDRFLAMLSHELRNPLAAVLNAARMIEHLGATSPQSVEWVRVVERRSRHMARLLDDLLDIARITQNKVEIRRDVFDLATTVDGVVEEVQPRFDDQKLSLDVVRPNGSLLVEGDAARIHQIQVNLLTNAAKYTPSPGSVRYSVAREGGEAVIRVLDTGVGMSAEFLRRAFDLFVQADETLDRSEGGMGVGLTLVRSIVALHGGRVDARSEGPGRGSEFTVWLPLCEKSDGAAAVPGAGGDVTATMPPAPRRPRSILLVEDDPDIRSSLEALLTLDGYEVHAAADGESALELAGRARPEVALVDVGIPRISGFELARMLRSRFKREELRLIALTGYGRPSDREEAFQAGFDEHLTKPCDLDDLCRVLESG
ncbi:MAG: chemotaxis protein CheB [Isosphaeraceae bacterium]